jgi:hypothetical protein
MVGNRDWYLLSTYGEYAYKCEVEDSNNQHLTGKRQERVGSYLKEKLMCRFLLNKQSRDVEEVL